MKKITLLSVFVLSLAAGARAQGLLDEINQETKPTREYVIGTFKGVRVINGHSVEMPGKGELLFIIQHRFGYFKGGIVDFFGLDQASIRMGLEYTMPFYDRLCVGFGRSTYMKTWDAFIKYKVLKQSKGPKSFPLTVDLLASMGISSMDQPPNQQNYFSSRMWFCYQVLIARKFGNRFSLQLTPTVVHKNLVPKREDQNTAFFLGLSGRVKLSNRVAISAEYFWPVYGQNFAEVNGQSILGPLSIGVDWETGGHVFQFQVTNANAMTDQGFIAETTSDWLNGDIRFGFNITRTFNFKKSPRKTKLETTGS